MIYMFQTVFRPSSRAQNCKYGVRYLSDRNSGFLESPETPASRSHPKLRVPGVTRKSAISESSGFHESPGTPGSRIHPEIRVPGVIRKSGYPSPRNSVFPESPRTPSSRSHTGPPIHAENRVPEVTLCSLSHPDLRVFGVTRNSGFLDSPVSPGDETRVPGDSNIP